MNVYDTANRLAYEIKESEEYKSYKRIKDAVMSDAEKKKKISEFEQLRYEVQLNQYTGEQKDEEKAQKLAKMYEELVASLPLLTRRGSRTKVSGRIGRFSLLNPSMP